MFICNHCPYVKAIIKDLVEDINELKKVEFKQWLLCRMMSKIIGRS